MASPTRRPSRRTASTATTAATPTASLRRGATRQIRAHAGSCAAKSRRALRHPPSDASLAAAYPTANAQLERHLDCRCHGYPCRGEAPAGCIYGVCYPAEGFCGECHRHSDEEHADQSQFRSDRHADPHHRHEPPRSAACDGDSGPCCGRRLPGPRNQRCHIREPNDQHQCELRRVRHRLPLFVCECARVALDGCMPTRENTP